MSGAPTTLTVNDKLPAVCKSYVLRVYRVGYIYVNRNNTISRNSRCVSKEAPAHLRIRREVTEWHDSRQGALFSCRNARARRVAETTIDACQRAQNTRMRVMTLAYEGTAKTRYCAELNVRESKVISSRGSNKRDDEIVRC